MFYFYLWKRKISIPFEFLLFRNLCSKFLLIENLIFGARLLEVSYFSETRLNEIMLVHIKIHKLFSWDGNVNFTWEQNVHALKIKNSVMWYHMAYVTSKLICRIFLSNKCKDGLFSFLEKRCLHIKSFSLSLRILFSKELIKGITKYQIINIFFIKNGTCLQSLKKILSE